MELQYDAAWVGVDVGRPLSLSLPVNLHSLPIKGGKIGNDFDNLLRDSDAIRRPAAEPGCCARRMAMPRTSASGLCHVVASS